VPQIRVAVRNGDTPSHDRQSIGGAARFLMRPRSHPGQRIPLILMRAVRGKDLTKFKAFDINADTSN
jgi:hypothetical protein